MKFNKAQLVAMIAMVLTVLDWLTNSGVLSEQATVKVLIFTNFLGAILPPLAKPSGNRPAQGYGNDNYNPNSPP